ncbi:uncharacterized protein PGTG_04834 [Puccinia graminis f. sp. tritici CRL 75-36-700-3]|uniref:Uncharacterized protein n=1 Tax=Puccinia graminis f. sp. tritici (strain CRL 75-36-700-3 / race SCCL) TaxID=418459 RepID=E3K321_PUCGT|nr:uncharacterized protein PGTG_04834 [Puccinia graminis f. sp. tritici CRL 75-36-700-3]EFP78878.1 hypothetical protein PGTG_04834 [Puccinia graminis f. sp. tritici CRL 75-36-700-3]
MSSKTTESQLSGSNTDDPTVSGLSASQSAAPAKAIVIRSKPHPASGAQPARKQQQPTTHSLGKLTSKEQAPTDEIIVIDEMTDVPSRDRCSNLNLKSTVGGGILIELTDTSDSEQSTCADTTTVTEEDANMAISGRDESTTHNGLGNDDRERLWKCAMDADLRGDLAASEMFCRLLKVETKPVNIISTKPKPAPPPPKHRATPVAIKRIPPKKNSESKTPVPLPEKAVRLDDKPAQESVKQGGLVFTSGAVLKHTSSGFNAFFERNIRELKSPLPLTIFNKEWQEASLTCHVHKRSKNSKDHRYAGHSYPSEWSQNYASWTMNHRNFHTTLRDVYGLTDFADKMLKHKENVDHLHSVHGFLPAFRYDLLMRADTFSRRVTVNGLTTVPDISKVRKDLWETCYAQSQRLDELNFNENPYCEGGVRHSWDPLTGARKGARENFRSMVPDLYPEINQSPRPYKRAPDDKPVDDYPGRSARGGFGIDRGRDKRSEPLWDPAVRGPAWTEQYLVPRGDR